MLEETLSKEQLATNDRRKGALLELIASGDAVLMAGAGCSGGLYPPWPKFVAELQSAAIAHDPKFNGGSSDDFLTFADNVKNCLGDDKYYAFIYKTFKPGTQKHRLEHEVLCRLPFRAITTTNYDLVLESALNVVFPNPANSLHFEGATKTKIHEFLMSMNHNKNLSRSVAHLHGVYDQPDSIVLGGKEYSSKYGFLLTDQPDTIYDQIQKGLSPAEFEQALVTYGYQWPLRRKLLWALLATRRIVFIGFSLNDPYFLKMLDYVKDDLATYYSESHFLILRVTKNDHERSMAFADRLNADYGIETVFFFDEPGDYSGLAKFIQELDVLNEVVPFADKVVEEPVPVATPGKSSVRNKLLELGKKQYSDENKQR